MLMRIIEVARPGGPEELVLGNAAVPVCGDDEVLIKVAAAGVNRPDILQRRGHYAPPPGAPTNPGLEVAGVIAAVGRNVQRFEVGERVCALLAGGGYSEYCAVHAGQVLPVPGSLSLIEAASLPEVYFTVWSNLYEFGRLQAGQSLLVHGGSSGIGSAAIQLATALGSTVYATVGDDDKGRFCESLGARRAINYNTQDFAVEIASLTDARGVNVVLDMVGGSYLGRNLQALAIEGRLVMIAAQRGTKGEMDLMLVMQRRLSITGSLLRPRSVEFKTRMRDKLLEHVWPLFSAGLVRPVVDRVFALEDASGAHAYMESGAHRGKIVLSVDDGIG